MAGPRVSVIVPTYNQAGFLRECLGSLAAQTMPDWEAIVINNHSDDDTVEVVERLNDARVTLIHFRNNGIIAASRNLGMEKARAGWIAFLDSDDRWRPAKLERCLAAVTPDIDVLGHGMVMFRDEREVRTVRSGPEARTRYRSLLFDGTCITPSAVMVRKDWLDRVGRFSEDAGYQTAEDYELWLKLSRAGARFAFIPDPLTEYRMHGASASGSVATHLAAGLKIV
ncbi:MAG: glycosyltransferase family 2 protein, partial [Rhodospirillales bacterium]